MKETAESYLGEKVEQAVITVPAYFNDANAKPPRTPAKLPALRFYGLSMSRQRALAYGLDKNDGQTIAVYDLGAARLMYQSWRLATACSR